jgi:hypothetical protein
MTTEIKTLIVNIDDNAKEEKKKRIEGKCISLNLIFD